MALSSVFTSKLLEIFTNLCTWPVIIRCKLSVENKSMKQHLTLDRIVCGAPLSHILVILFYHSQVVFFSSIMASLLCYVILKFAYFISFDRVNSILDETLLKFMIFTSIFIGLGCDIYEIGMKVDMPYILTKLKTIQVFR